MSATVRNGAGKCRAPLKLIVLLSDGIKGHLNQSRGVAHQLAEMTGAEVFEAEVPPLAGSAKLRSGIGAKKFMQGGKREALEWLASYEGDELMRSVGKKFAEYNIGENSNEVMILSAGGRAARFNLALAYIWRCRCATVMTPGFIGTEPFDFAIVPEHDSPGAAPNVYVTLGAPNFIVRENLKSEAEKFLAENPPRASKKWSVLIGGDDANYRINGKWITKNVGRLLRMAENLDAELYVTTSRRTSADASEALKKMKSESSSFRYLLVASETDFNPIPAMLGFSDEVFCTDDSVNMVSEAITGGHTVVLMRAGRKLSPRSPINRAIAFLADKGALPKSAVRGVRRFESIFDRLSRQGALVYYSDWLRGSRGLFANDGDADEWSDFNEARDAAKWICDNWQRRR